MLMMNLIEEKHSVKFEKEEIVDKEQFWLMVIFKL